MYWMHMTGTEDVSGVIMKERGRSQISLKHVETALISVVAKAAVVTEVISNKYIALHLFNNVF